jgi:hypothetical protein
VCHDKLRNGSTEEIDKIYKEAFFLELELFILANNMRSEAVNDAKEIAFCFQGGRIFHTEEDPKKGVFQFQSKGCLANASSDIYEPAFLLKHFQARGYDCLSPRWIGNYRGSTILVGAAVQVLEEIVHHETPLLRGRSVLCQPVIRSQFAGLGDVGFLSTFINVATVALNPTMREHFVTFYDWLAVFDSLAFERQRLSFIARPAFSDGWKEKHVRTLAISVMYDGLELGDINFIYNISQHTRPWLVVSDCGFGYERLCWVLKGGNYFAGALGPLSPPSGVSPIWIDNIRASVLLAASSIKPSNSGAGYRLKKFVRSLVVPESDKNITLCEMIRECYSFWIKWTNLSLTVDRTVYTIKTLYDNARSILLQEQLVAMGKQVQVMPDKSPARVFAGIKNDPALSALLSEYSEFS